MDQDNSSNNLNCKEMKIALKVKELRVSGT